MVSWTNSTLHNWTDRAKKERRCSTMYLSLVYYVEPLKRLYKQAGIPKQTRKLIQQVECWDVEMWDRMCALVELYLIAINLDQPLEVHEKLPFLLWWTFFLSICQEKIQHLSRFYSKCFGMIWLCIWSCQSFTAFVWGSHQFQRIDWFRAKKKKVQLSGDLEKESLWSLIWSFLLDFKVQVKSITVSPSLP